MVQTELHIPTTLCHATRASRLAGCFPGACTTDLVPDEDGGRDADDFTAQVHLGTSDIPDVLGGRHNGRTYKRSQRATSVFQKLNISPWFPRTSRLGYEALPLVDYLKSISKARLTGFFLSPA